MVQGSKNAALPLIAAALLCGEQTMLTNCPQIHDVEVMLSLVEELGGSVLVEGHQVMIDSHTFDKTVICQDAVKELRASVLLMGACLAKFGEVTISYPDIVLFSCLLATQTMPDFSFLFAKQILRP